VGRVSLSNAGAGGRLSWIPDRLPDLRLLTPSDYDRALLAKPLKNCPTSLPCSITVKLAVVSLRAVLRR
jgi:hypothetical protein